MASSSSPSDPAAIRNLGRLLTSTEAKDIADRLADGDTLTVALRAVPASRRAEVKELMDCAGLGLAAGNQLIVVLRAVEGARSAPTQVDPIWTMPGHLARGGPLTTSARHLVEHARQSVTCSTFNFQRSSGLWHALRKVAQRPQLAVRVYLDAEAADHGTPHWSPTTTEVAAHLKPATVLRTKEFDGSRVRNHAKFLAVDHRFLLVTSANFSRSAEYTNIEFGALLDNPYLTESVERELLLAEDALYERVIASPT